MNDKPGELRILSGDKKFWRKMAGNGFGAQKENFPRLRILEGKSPTTRKSYDYFKEKFS